MGRIYKAKEGVTLLSYGQITKVTLYVSSYINNNLTAIIGEHEDGESFGSLTINLGKNFKEYGEFVTTIKDEYYEQLLEKNIIEEEISEIIYGFNCKAHLCKINMSKFELKLDECN